MKRLFATICTLSRPATPLASAAGLAIMLSLAVQAQQQYQGFCAAVKIEILQELTLERIGFLATLEVTNNDAVDPITGFTAGLRFTQPQSGGVQEDATALFWVRQPELININGIDGEGNIAPGAKATVKWFIVPKPGAGGLVPDETHFLNALKESVATGRVPADELLAKYHGEWQGDLGKIYSEYSY